MKSAAPINENGRREPRKKKQFEDLTLEELIAGKNPGATYQHKYYEYTIRDYEWNTILDEAEDRLELERIRDLKEQLANIVIEAAINCLTPKQLIIFERFYIDGLNQSRIAEEIGSNQCHVQKALYGNLNFYNGKPNIYGGIIRKLQKYLKNNYEVEILLIEIRKE